jgi:uncharacterized protein YcbK (DUF882 family)
MAISRRDFLRRVRFGALLLLPSRRAFASRGESRALDFEHTHTGESLSVTYWADGRYVPEALARVDRLLRDFRTGDVHAIDPKLLDLLHELRVSTGASAPYQVISGYRSPETNAMLRAQGRKVGSRSLHMKGEAIDVRLADVPTARVRDVALKLARGGVGYYEKKDFVHVDVGRVRRW